MKKITNNKNEGVGLLLKDAFTLIELLAVIIILAIVALIATPIILNVIEDARISAGSSEASMIYSGINNYCAASVMEQELNGTVDICADGVTIDEVSQMVNLGNATVTEVVYGSGKVTNLIVESNGHKFTLCGDGTFAMDDNECGIDSPENPGDPEGSDGPNLNFSSTSSDGKWIKATTITVTAVGKSNLESFTYEVFNNGISQGIQTVNVSGKEASTNISLSLDGIYTIKLVGIDEYGNKTEIESGTYQIDVTAPVIETSDVTIYNTDVATYDLLTGVVVSDNSGVTPRVEYTPTNISETVGDYVISYTVTDEAGNFVTKDRIINVQTKGYTWAKYNAVISSYQTTSYTDYTTILIGHTSDTGLPVNVGTWLDYFSFSKPTIVSDTNGKFTFNASEWTKTNHSYQHSANGSGTSMTNLSGYTKLYMTSDPNECNHYWEVTFPQTVNFTQNYLGSIEGYATIYTHRANYTRGTFIEYVTSESESAYPINGKSGSYWYVKQ